MQCSSCGTSNPEGAKFCMNCGNRLSAPSAGLEPPAPEGPPAANIPDTGQAAIASPVLSGLTAPKTDRPAAEMQGERRVVTVLFCDVTGSTAMAEGMDPEEWTGIMNEAFRLLMEPISHYEGTVARLMGDAILAFFGAPAAHEDDPQRAILAGLEILRNIQGLRNSLGERYGLDFNVRVGINTGLVVVGKVGSDLKTEYTAMGDAVNVAARMEQTARPGTLQIAEETYQSVSTLFEFQPLGAIPIKGKKEPVQAYQVLARKEGALPARGLAGLQSPLVGRDAELLKLQQSIHDLLQGKGQVISVIGEAGLGKSRLVAELGRWVQNQEETQRVGWYQGRSLSYQANTPFAPFIDLFRKQFHLEDRGSPDNSTYAQIKHHLGQFMDHPEQVAPPLAALMGIDIPGEDRQRIQYLTPPQLRERIFQAVTGWIGCLANQEKTVLVFEDIHWMDSLSIELLETLFGLAGRSPLLVIVLFRPNRQDRSWKLHETAKAQYAQSYTPIFLQPLDDAQSRALVANLLEIEDLPEKTRGLILSKAEGNPFYVEEVIRSLLDSKLVVRQGDHWVATANIQNIRIPDTLSGVITARLDRLDEASRQVTQEAAVIGREFAYPVLEDVHNSAHSQPAPLDPAIQTLQQRELVREKSQSPWPVYAFKHVLTQETAYNSLLISRRRALHLRVAECLEKNEPNRAGEIARHFWEAVEYDRALPFLVEASSQAARTYATAEAIGLFEKAIEILPQVKDTSLARKAYEGMGSALTFANRIPESIANYQAMHAFGASRNDAPMQVSAMNKLSDIIAMRLGQFPEAEKLLSDSENLARRLDDKPGLAEMFIIRCSLCTAAGDLHGAINYLDEAVQVSRSMNQAASVALGLVHIANTQVWMTDFEKAWETAQQSLKISREIGNRELQSEVLAEAIPLCYWRQANSRAAYESAREGTRIAAEIGAAMPESLGAYFAGRTAMERGDYETALAYEEQSVRAGQEFGAPFLSVFGLCALGSIYLQITPGMREKTIEAHTQAVQALQLPGGMFGAGLAWLDLGFCALALGEEKAAVEYFQKGLNVPNPQMLILRPHHLVGMAVVSMAQGNLRAAQEYLDEAVAFALEKGMQNYTPLLEFVQGQLYRQRGELGKALEHLDRSVSLAAQNELRPILWQAHAEAARALRQMGRPSAAQSRLQQARAVIDEIAGFFVNEQYRKAFLDSALRQVSVTD